MADFSDHTTYLTFSSIFYACSYLNLHTVNCLLLVFSMRAFKHMMTAPELLWLGCPRPFVLKRGLHLSVCKHRFTAAMHAASQRGTTDSPFTIPVQRNAVLPLCHHDDMHIHVLLYVQWHRGTYCIGKDNIAVHLTCARTHKANWPFISVTKVTSRHRSQPVKAML